MAANTSGIKAGRAYVELGVASQLDKGLRDAEQRLRAFSKNVQAIGAKLTILAAAALAPLTLATHTFAGFADKMSAVKAITGASDEQFRRLNDTAKQLGATTSFTASQVAEAMQFLGMAGFSTEQILAGIPAVLDLARAGAIDLGQAADIASDVGSAFGLAAEDIGRIADVMATTASSANTSVAMMGESLKYAAPLAKAAGQSLDDTATAIGVLGNSGIKASMAGTDLAMIFKRMAGDAKGAIEGMGVSVVDAEGRIRSVVDVMRELGEATRGLTEEERLNFFADAFDRSAKSAIILADAGGSMTDLRDKIAGAEGSAAKMAATMSDNLGGSIRAFKSALEGLQIAVGEALAGPLRERFADLTNLLRILTSLVQNNPQLVVAFSTAATAVGAFGVALVVTAKAAEAAAVSLGVLRAAVTGVRSAITATTRIVGLLANPTGLAVVAIGALAVGLIAAVGAVLYFSGALDGVIAAVREAFGPIVATVTTALDGVRSALAQGDLGAAFQIALTAVQLAAAQFAQWLLAQLGGVVDVVRGVVAKIGQAYMGLLGVLASGQLRGAIMALAVPFAIAVANVTLGIAAIRLAWKALTIALPVLWEQAVQAVQATGRFLAGVWEVFRAAAALAWDAVSAIFAAGVRYVVDQFDQVAGAARMVFGLVASVAGAVAGAIATAVRIAVRIVTNLVATVAAAVGAAVRTFAAPLAEAFRAIGAQVSAIVGDIGRRVALAFEGALANLRGVLAGLGTTLQSLGTWLSTPFKIGSAAAAAWFNQVVTVLGAVADFAAAHAQTLQDVLGAVFKFGEAGDFQQAWQVAMIGIELTMLRVQKLFVVTWNSAIDNVATALTKIGQAIAQMMGMLMGEMQTARELAANPLAIASLEEVDRARKLNIAVATKQMEAAFGQATSALTGDREAARADADEQVKALDDDIVRKQLLLDIERGRAPAERPEGERRGLPGLIDRLQEKLQTLVDGVTKSTEEANASVAAEVEKLQAGLGGQIGAGVQAAAVQTGVGAASRGTFSGAEAARLGAAGGGVQERIEALNKKMAADLAKIAEAAQRAERNGAALPVTG